MKHSPHIVYIITKLELGGAQKVCLALFKELKKENIDTLLISGTQGTLASHVEGHQDALLLEELTRERGTIINEAECFYKLLRILRTLRKKYPDLIIHTHSTKAGLLGRWAAFFARVPYRVHTIHGYAFHKYQSFVARITITLFEWITSFITTHFICVSSEDAKTGIKLLHAFSRRHTIIRAAVDWQQFYISTRSCSPFPEGKPFIFGTIACFKKQKNLFDLLKAFHWTYSHNKETRLEIIGDGALRPAITEWINAYNLNEVITLHGWQETVAPYMLNWHTFVLSSLWEGLPCAIVEARLLKLPVLSYNTGGIHDVIIDGKNGLLFEQHDWQGLAHKMFEVSKKKEIHYCLSTYKDNLKDFRIDAMIKQHIQLYHRLCKQNTLS